MRAFHPIINVCLVFSLQIFLTGSLYEAQTLTGSLSDPQTLSGSLSDPHPVPIAIGGYRDPQGGLLICDSPFEGGQGDVNMGKSVKIGLLIQNKNSVAALQAAELAVRLANEKGGVNGTTIQLVVRSMEGSWGTGSKQAVAMIFDENVIAILGSHDGRNAHLVEQVTAKSGLVFLSAWSSDPSLSQAFVPWFFNCVPNDLQQADALIEEIFNNRKLTKTALVSDKSYDSQAALRNFLKKVTREGKPEPLQFLYDSTGNNNNDLVKKLKSTEIECIIMFVQPPASMKMAELININHINQPVYGSLALLDENSITGDEMNYYEKLNIVSTVNLSDGIGILFSEEYRKSYGNLPGAVAAFAFDGMNILIECIRKAGTEREKIQKAISEMKYEGVTGTIQFDERGNRKGTPGFVEIKNGIPVSVKK